MAKCLNCEKGVTSSPCEACSTCTEINEGRFIDLIEVDAASRTKVEDTRELLDNVQYSSTRGRFKVYLIDEVHMLSNHSFNALLKTSGRAPAHVKFLFATTDPQKLPITILSRCLQFNLKNLSPKLIVEYLERVMQQEQIKCDSDALWQLAVAASGSMRDALTLADQAISFCQGEVNDSGVIEMLGVPEQAQVFELLSAMAKGDLPLVLSLVETISDHTPDYSNTLDSLLSTLHRVAIAQAAPTAVDNSFGDKRLYSSLLQNLPPKIFSYFINWALKDGVNCEVDWICARIRDAAATDDDLFTKPGRSKPMPSQAGSDDSDQHSDQWRDGQSEISVERPLLETAGGPAVSEPADSAQSQKKKTLANQHESDSRARQHASTPKSVRDESQPPAEGLQEPTQSEVRRSDLLRTLTHESWMEVFPSLSVSGIVRSILANTQWEEFSEGILVLRLAEDQSALYTRKFYRSLRAR